MQIRTRFALLRNWVQRAGQMMQVTGAVTLVLVIFPLAAQAQSSGSPFDTGFTSLQNLFTGTIAKVASLIAIVVGGYMFAHGEPGAKRSRFAYVSVSRASFDARIYTNDAASLAKDLSREVTKSAAMELSQSVGQNIAGWGQGIRL